tara:strand:- start:369 stop:539 length:171 start_codon:yes stop_codon:yes gene_type:complete
MPAKWEKGVSAKPLQELVAHLRELQSALVTEQKEVAKKMEVLKEHLEQRVSAREES